MLNFDFYWMYSLPKLNNKNTKTNETTAMGLQLSYYKLMLDYLSLAPDKLAFRLNLVTQELM